MLTITNWKPERRWYPADQKLIEYSSPQQAVKDLQKVQEMLRKNALVYPKSERASGCAPSLLFVIPIERPRYLADLALRNAQGIFPFVFLKKISFSSLHTSKTPPPDSIRRVSTPQCFLIASAKLTAFGW